MHYDVKELVVYNHNHSISVLQNCRFRVVYTGEQATSNSQRAHDNGWSLPPCA